MRKPMIFCVLALAACMASCGSSSRADVELATAVGRELALKLHPDSTPSEMQNEAVVLDLRHRESLLRQQNRNAEADALSASFLSTLDSLGISF